jgi:ligand-binding sensor domain-containing protein/signal transduction histidine kinase
MRAYLFHFILILFLAGCKGNSDKKAEIIPPLYPEPITVVLNTTAGYAINQLTGDSIKPLRTSSGGIFKTGVPITLFAKAIGKEIIQPKIIEGVRPVQTIIPGNIHPILDKLLVITVDTARLKKVKLGEGDQSFVLRNTYGAVPTGIPIPVTGKKMSFIEPHPVKAAPMRFRDNATTSIQYLDVDQGLGYSYVTAICEDKKGNLWFGIDGVGISKYDGINITTYSVKEGLTHNIVRSIIEDRNNNLWIATNGGVTCFDGENFIQYTEKEGLPANEVLSILEDKKGCLWFCTVAGLTRYDGKSFINYTQKEGLPSNGVYKCIEDRNGKLWIGTYRGAAKFDGNSFTHYTPEDGLAGYIISTLLEDKKGNIWLGSIGGVSMFDGNKFTRYTTKEGLPGNTIWSMVEDDNGNIWISTSNGGLNKYDGKSFTYYSKQQGLSNSKVRAMTKDRVGNLWLATEGGGVNKISAISFNYEVPEEVVEYNRIRPILKDKNGNLWFGTENANVGKLNTENAGGKGRLFTYYNVQDKSFERGQRSLLQDKNGNIWIGTNASGIIKYDGKNFTNYSLGISQGRQSIFDILEDKKGNIWFGQRDGSIVRYDGENFILYSAKDGLPGSIIYSMLEDKKGNIWFCTEGAGVYQYDGTTLINYTEKEGLFAKSVTSVAEDDKGNIWMGTLGAGVCRFDGTGFTYYTVQQGLPDNNVWSVFCDSLKQLWFGTDKGLALCIPKMKKQNDLKTGYAFFSFGSQDGLKAVDFNLHSVCADNDNHIWWGTGKSVVSFDLNKEFHADSLRSLSLNYIEINERFYDFRNIAGRAKSSITFSAVFPFHNYPADLTLAYDQNHLSFHFSAIDWSAPDKIKYSYRLLGSDENWSSPSPDAIAEYRGLRHGKYEFQLKAIGQSRVWTDPVNYSFTIQPPWWLTGWFKWIVASASLIAAFFIIRFIYLYQLRRQKALLEKRLAVQYERQRISTEMHDDIGAGLSGIKLMTEIAKKKSRDEETVSDMEKIYQSVGDISSKMKEVIWSLNTENDSLSSLIGYLQRQARMMMENYPGQFSMTLPDKIPDIKISGDARRHIYLLVKEALHNIIKHSGADNVEITITCDHKLRIVVSDNGKGLGTDENNDDGNGVKNMRQRIQQLNGDFFIKNKEGLTLTFEIPLKPAL